MKSHKAIYLLGLMCILIIASSCAKSSYITVTPSSEISRTQPTNKLSPTLTRAINGATSTSLSTATYTSMPVPTFTWTSSPVPTAISTLTVEDARIKLQKLLTDNGDCRLPCFLGVTPGESTYEEALNVFFQFSSISMHTAFDPTMGTIMPVYRIENDLKINYHIAFQAENSIITFVAFDSAILQEKTGANDGYHVIDVFDSSFFGEQLRLYMLPNILTKYGRPSSVFLSTMSKPSPNIRELRFFHILLLYPDQGILVDYKTEMKLVDQNVLGCPSNAHVEMELFPSGAGNSFFDLLEPTYWPESIRSNYKPLEDVTSLSLEEFYQTFRQPTDKCIETPANLWPEPER